MLCDLLPLLDMIVTAVGTAMPGQVIAIGLDGKPKRAF